jgi:hypothetical protein
MKIIVLCFIITISTFILGTSFYSITEKLSFTNICKISEHPFNYNNKLMKIDCTIYKDKTGIVITELSCHSNEHIFIKVENENDAQIKVINDLFQQFGNDEIKYARVNLEGKFNSDYSPGCFNYKYGIKITKIKLFSPIKSSSFENFIRLYSQ